MNDNSLMNPDFLQKELADSFELLLEDEMYTRELTFAIDKALNHIHSAPRGYSNSITLNSEQVSDIVKVLVEVNMKKYKYTSARKVFISQLRQLLQDARYRRATAFHKLFRNK
jgi:uncharacterized damage-inducible protein DinB